MYTKATSNSFLYSLLIKREQLNCYVRVTSRQPGPLKSNLTKRSPSRVSLVKTGITEGCFFTALYSVFVVGLITAS